MGTPLATGKEQPAPSAQKPLSRRKRAVFTLLTLALFAFAAFFAEVLARAFFPELNGEVFGPGLTRGVHIHGAYLQRENLRVPSGDFQFDSNRPFIVFLGDSVAFGYGLQYEDTFPRRVERLLALSSPDLGRPQVAVLATDGDSPLDMSQRLARLNAGGLPIHAVVYQFNFNDVTPISGADLKHIAAR